MAWTSDHDISTHLRLIEFNSLLFSQLFFPLANSYKIYDYLLIPFWTIVLSISMCQYIACQNTLARNDRNSENKYKYKGKIDPILSRINVRYIL